MTLRSTAADFAFKMISHGLRVPRTKAFDTVDQWGRLIDLLARLRINVFLDVGANKGFFAKHLRQSGFADHIFSFEPIVSDCDHIRRLSVGDKKWRVFEYALGSESGEKEFNISSTDGQTVLSSFLPRVGGGSISEPTTAQVRRLDEVLGSLLADIKEPRIFLKMDTQGFDSQVIEGAKGNLDRVLGLQSEISVLPLYEGSPHYLESLALYRELGFDLIDLFVVNRTDDGRVLEYDCLMARSVHL